MAISITIVGSRDPQIEDALRATGLPASPAWCSDLGVLTASNTPPPNVVIVDLRGVPHIPSGLALLKRQHPSAGVIIVASTLDPALMLEAMRAGVNECITEPISSADLNAAITRLVGKLASPVAGSVFAVIGAKGGVGTTTTAVNLAASLARLTRAGTLLIDLHLAYGDTSVFLGAEPRYSVLDALENLHRFDEAFLRSLVAHTEFGVDLLGPATRPAAAPVEARQISGLVSLASNIYPNTVLDVPRSDAVALEALDQASAVVIVANQELATVRNAGRMAGALRRRYPRSRVHTIVNRADQRSDILQEDIERVVGSSIVHQLPNDYRRALEAMNKGRPVASDSHHELSAAFDALARDLAGIQVEGRTRRPGSGFLGRLAGLRS